MTQQHSFATENNSTSKATKQPLWWSIRSINSWTNRILHFLLIADDQCARRWPKQIWADDMWYGPNMGTDYGHWNMIAFSHGLLIITDNWLEPGTGRVTFLLTYAYAIRTYALYAHTCMRNTYYTHTRIFTLYTHAFIHDTHSKHILIYTIRTSRSDAHICGNTHIRIW